MSKKEKQSGGKENVLLLFRMSILFVSLVANDLMREYLGWVVVGEFLTKVSLSFFTLLKLDSD